MFHGCAQALVVRDLRSGPDALGGSLPGAWSQLTGLQVGCWMCCCHALTLLASIVEPLWPCYLSTLLWLLT